MKDRYAPNAPRFLDSGMQESKNSKEIKETRRKRGALTPLAWLLLIGVTLAICGTVAELKIHEAPKTSQRLYYYPYGFPL